MNLGGGKKIKEETESDFEKGPTKEEIFEILGVDAEKCTIGQEKYDQMGLYRFDFTMEGGFEYDYMRAGEFDGSHKSPESYICETTPTTWPEKIWVYEKGGWRKLN